MGFRFVFRCGIVAALRSLVAILCVRVCGWATEGGFLDNRVVGGGPEDGWVGLTLNA